MVERSGSWIAIVSSLAALAGACGPLGDVPQPPPDCSAFGCGSFRCSDGQRDGNESDNDCGGSCLPCGEGRSCVVAGDCMSGICDQGTCAAATGFRWVGSGLFKADVRDVAAADFDGDGLGDVVVFDGVLGLFLKGNGAGGFARAPISIDVGPVVGGRSGDFDGDGKDDLAVVTSSAVPVASGVSAFAMRNLGAGQFGNGGVPIATDPLTAIAAADFNEDGRLDVVGASTAIFLLPGDGRGGFAPWQRLAVRGAPGLVAADFDGDGHADIALAGSQGHATEVMFGRGDGMFDEVEVTSTGALQHMATADFDGDGQLNLVLDDPTTGIVSTWLQKTPRKFVAAPGVMVGQPLAALVAADWNGDGVPDVAAVYDTKVALLFGAHDGRFTFGDSISFSFGFEPVAAAAAGDWNSDGKSDLAIGRGATGVDVFLNQGGGHFRSVLSVGTRTSTGIASGDWDGDGKLDLIAGDSQQLQLLRGDGGGGFAITSFYSTAHKLVVAGDFDGDGNLDCVGAGDGQVLLMAGDGRGGLKSAARRVSLRRAPWSSLVLDLNGDGHADYLLGTVMPSQVQLLRGDETMSLSASPPFDLDGSPAGLAAVDTDGDGRLEVVAMRPDRRDLVQLALAKDETLRLGRNVPLTEDPVALASGDLNGDGRADVAVAMARHVEVLVNSGRGDLLPLGLALSTQGAPLAIAIGDFDGDGNRDLVVLGDGLVNQMGPVSGPRVSLFLGRGDGTFEAPSHYETLALEGERNVFMRIADLDGNGLPDVVIAASYGDFAALLAQRR